MTPFRTSFTARSVCVADPFALVSAGLGAILLGAETTLAVPAKAALARGL
ncbi:MAG: hypothetical protein NVS3B20_05160 [Polyangiales bacterium]